MKKVIINMSKLSLGGMEKALVNLLNQSKICDNFDVTLLLVYKGNPSYVDELPTNIKLDIVHKGKWSLFGKLKATFSLGFRYIKSILNKNKYDVSICYTHHHGILAKLTKNQSKNSIVFIHADMAASRNKKTLDKLLNKMKFDEFSKIVCVSNLVREKFLKLYPHCDEKTTVINNYINGKDIIKKSKADIKDYKKSTKITFVNVARQDEKSKKISRIINACEKLRNENYDFRVLLVGDGKDSIEYQKMVKNKKLENIIFFVGYQKNPYPYYLLSDAIILSSNAEGYGIVIDEARVLNIPFISTDVGDVKNISSEGYGIVTQNNEIGIYEGMKRFLDNGYIISKKFNYQEFNDIITKRINDILK